MTPARKKRIALVFLMLLGVGAAAAFALNAFNQNLMFFFSPSELLDGKAPPGAVLRLGGMVVEGSIQRPEKGMTTRFDLTDNLKTITVEYTGILPDLFREGQGIVAKGQLNGDGSGFVASEVLAKHDENYMPPEVAEKMHLPKPEGVK